MPRCPPVPIETMCAMAVPGGYAPPFAAQSDVSPPPQPPASPEHDAIADEDEDDQQGGNNFGDFDSTGSPLL